MEMFNIGNNPYCDTCLIRPSNRLAIHNGAIGKERRGVEIHRAIPWRIFFAPIMHGPCANVSRRKRAVRARKSACAKTAQNKEGLPQDSPSIVFAAAVALLDAHLSGGMIPATKLRPRTMRHWITSFRLLKDRLSLLANQSDLQEIFFQLCACFCAVNFSLSFVIGAARCGT
jgi:hypothetical protein